MTLFVVFRSNSNQSLLFVFMPTWHPQYNDAVMSEVFEKLSDMCPTGHELVCDGSQLFVQYDLFLLHTVRQWDYFDYPWEQPCNTFVKHTFYFQVLKHNFSKHKFWTTKKKMQCYQMLGINYN